jgi:hypothetical protein
MLNIQMIGMRNSPISTTRAGILNAMEKSFLLFFQETLRPCLSITQPCQVIRRRTASSQPPGEQSA